MNPYQTPRGDTVIFSNIYRLEPFFGVQNFEFQHFWGVSEKCIFFWCGDFVDIFCGHHEIGLVLGFISMYFRIFSQGNIFGVLDIPDIFLGIQ